MPDETCPSPASAERFPSSWYPFCRSRDLAPGTVLRVQALGAGWAVFRDVAGAVAVLPARCPHFGADLAAGRVEGGSLRCPLHGWRYAADGACSGSGRVARALPVAERAGIVFARLGDSAGPAPVLPGGDLVWSRVHAVELASDWRVVAVNGYDALHLPVVHRRELVGTPWHGRRGAAYGMSYRARVAGSDWHDRLNRLIGLAEVEVDVTCWGGNHLLFAHRRTAAVTVVALLPIAPRRCRAFVVTARARSGAGRAARCRDLLLVGAVQRGVLGFMREDRDSTAGVAWDPSGLVAAADAPVIGWAQWFADLPRAERVPA